MQLLPRVGAVRAPRMVGLEGQPVVFFLRGWPAPLPWHKSGPHPWVRISVQVEPLGAQQVSP